MRRFPAIFSIRSWARFCLVALAYGALGPQPARAGCGDHVVVLSSLPPAQRAVFVRMLLSGSGGCSAGRQVPAAAPLCSHCPLATPGQQGPCRGPYCSNERAPEGTPATAPPTVIDPCTILERLLKLPAPALAGSLDGPAPRTAIARIDSIFHPPRAA